MTSCRTKTARASGSRPTNPCFVVVRPLVWPLGCGGPSKRTNDRCALRMSLPKPSGIVPSSLATVPSRERWHTCGQGNAPLCQSQPRRHRGRTVRCAKSGLFWTRFPDGHGDTVVFRVGTGTLAYCVGRWVGTVRPLCPRCAGTPPSSHRALADVGVQTQWERDGTGAGTMPCFLEGPSAFHVPSEHTRRMPTPPIPRSLVLPEGSGIALWQPSTHSWEVRSSTGGGGLD